MSNDFSMPWSAHDVAGAIRETLAATRAGAKLFELTGAAYSRRKARQAAGRLDGLAFLPDGLKEPLARIAAAEHSTAYSLLCGCSQIQLMR
jgi:hypothetical protein